MNQYNSTEPEVKFWAKDDGQKVVTVFLTSGEQTPMGKVLADIYYRNHSGLCDLAPGRTGYPHNGGQHSFSTTGTIPDVIAFLELVMEQYHDKPHFNDGDAISLLATVIFKLCFQLNNV